MKEPIQIGEMTITFLATREDTNNAVEMYELTLSPTGRETVPHIHRDEDLEVLGMNGVATWTVDGKAVDLHAGERLTIPKGIPHSLTNLREVPARMICMLTPGTMGPEFFREIAQHVGEKELDLFAITEVMSRYGIVPS
jgi:quercetin dioxygenase-like cupin family protein